MNERERGKVMANDKKAKNLEKTRKKKKKKIAVGRNEVQGQSLRLR